MQPLCWCLRASNPSIGRWHLTQWLCSNRFVHNRITCIGVAKVSSSARRSYPLETKGWKVLFIFFYEIRQNVCVTNDIWICPLGCMQSSIFLVWLKVNFPRIPFRGRVVWIYLPHIYRHRNISFTWELLRNFWFFCPCPLIKYFYVGIIQPNWNLAW